MNDIINEFYRMAAAAQVTEDEAGYDARGIPENARESARKYLVVPRCEFNDGYHVSIQAGYGKYSGPRITGCNEYHSFELGFPSAADDLLTEYAEEAERPTETVYGYVPVRVVVALAKKHGGIKGIYVLPDEPAAIALATSAADAPATTEG